MCGIVGLVVKEHHPDIRKNIVRLLQQSSIRGLHSFGYSYWDGWSVSTKKYTNLVSLIDDMPVVYEKMIFHNRYSTSGDYKDMKNNQPLFYNNTALAFNGVIDMRLKTQMEQAYGIEMETDNDGEVLLHKFPNYHPYIEGKSFSGLFLSDGKLIHYRNERRPAAIYEDENAIYIASTKDIFTRAMGVKAQETIPNREWTY